MKNLCKSTVLAFILFLSHITILCAATDSQPLGFLGIQVGESPDGRIGIAAVIEDSPAQIAGLKAGDQLIYVNGSRVTSIEQTIKLIRAVAAGSKVGLVINHEGEIKSLQVGLIEPPPSVQKKDDQESNLDNRKVDQQNQNASHSKSAELRNEFEAQLVKDIVSVFGSASGYHMTKVESFGPTEMPEALEKRIKSLIHLPDSETIQYAQIPDSWRHENLDGYQPHCLAVFTSKAVYVAGNWRDTYRSIHVDRISYREMLTRIKFQYDRETGNGTMQITDGRTIKTSSEVIQLLHAVHQAMGLSVSYINRSMVAARNAISEPDAKAIKGYGSAIWGANKNETLRSFGLEIGSNAQELDYSTETPNEIISKWAH